MTLPLWFELGAVDTEWIYLVHSYLFEQFGKYNYKVKYLSSYTDFSVHCSAF